jgi:hypothetical protein
LNRKDLFEDDQDIINVRIAKFEEWKRIEDELKKKVKGEKEMAEKAVEIQKKNKEYSNKLVTADTSGSLIHIRPIPNDRLSNDFLVSRSIIRDKSPDEKELQFTKEKEERNPKSNPLSNQIKNNNKSKPNS